MRICRNARRCFPRCRRAPCATPGSGSSRRMPTASSMSWRRTGRADLCKALALPLSAECLKDITGLTNMRFQDMDAWSQAMIDGIANYTGNKEIEARCHAATAGIDAAIDDMIPVVTQTSEHFDPQRAAGLGPDRWKASAPTSSSRSRAGRTSRATRFPARSGRC